MQRVSEEEKRYHWDTMLFLIFSTLAFLICVPWYLLTRGAPSTEIIVLSLILFFLSSFSVTLGMHRLYAHRSFKISNWIHYPLVWFNTLAAEGSIIEWASNHRHHHKSVDTDEDPYAINQGFWHAHFLWMFRKHRGIDFEIVKDLADDKLLYFQYKYYPFIFGLLTAITTGFVAWVTGDIFGAFTWSFVARIVLVHNFTFFINSAAHYWGEKTFSKEHSAVNNWFVALITLGEGYHNYHHTFPKDYRNGVRWWQYDPTKWTIWVMAKLGLASQLQEVSEKEIRERMDAEQRHESIANPTY